MTPSRLDRALLAVLRVGVALLWMQNAAWKDPPEFGALRHYTEFAVTREVFHPYALLVEHLVLPNFTFFGWTVLLVESALGAFLLVGLATRFWAVVGFAQATAITLSVFRADNEWHWSYFLMLLAHVAVFATAAGRYAGLDGLLRSRWQRSDSLPARLLVRAS